MNSITSKPPLGFEVTETRTYFAGSAVVYRVSRTNQQLGKLSWLDELSILISSYRKAL